MTLVSYVVLLWTWSVQGRSDDPDVSDETSVPNSQHICSLPPITGPCKAYFRRYFYDDNSKTCKVFIYGGCGGNLNNFETELKCMQTCQPEDACKQPKEPGICLGYFERYFYNTVSGKCEKFIYGGCGGNQNNFGSEEECVKSCCTEGERSLYRANAPGKAEVCSLPPKTGPCKAYIRRFFYNPTSMKCEVFVYGGCDGNRNNFENMAACKEACHTSDGRAASSPVIYEDDVCQLPPQTGSCRMYEDRYFYNSTSKCCDRFVYGGCEGNENNFKHKANCMQTCQPEEVCNQPPESGEHTGSFKRFFYNSTSRSCDVFIYGGCGGNQNRFKNRRECRRTCQPVDAGPYQGSPEIGHIEVCNLPPETGPCRGHIERYFYNSASSSCEVFVYGGCGGNENNFQNREQCMNMCNIAAHPSYQECLNMTEICNQPPEPGPCEAYIPSYYYDPVSMSCKRFIYGGCEGNHNNFKTKAECMQACRSNEVCNQPPETGQCTGYFRKYFYNPTSRDCERFVYGGCGGNDNNFDTKQACMKFCRT